MNRSLSKRLSVAVALSLTALAGPALAQTQAPAAEPNAAEKAWDATKNTSEKAWDATKSGTEKGWDATKKGSEKAWDATKSGTKKGWEPTKKGTKKGTPAAGNAGNPAISGTRKAGESIAEKLPPDPAKKP